MRTTIRKIGNSRGVLIPATMLAECGIGEDVELKLDGQRIVIEPVVTSRKGWFDGYLEQGDTDAWAELLPDADSEEWEW
ncbi:MAG: hypothetical protein JSR42_04095 [Proteobacteria bacterium]|nr:hypothetical protein [Pseudomonadota bacterium]